MKRMLMVAALGLVAGGQHALAADLPQAPAPMPRAPATYVPTVAPVYNWSGFYFGINGGGSFGDSTWTDPTFGGTSGSFSTDGFLVGGTVGANFQASQFVFGVEGDIDYSTLKGTGTPANGYCTTFFGAAAASGCETKSDYLATIRGRIGFAADRALIYGTGGGAFGDVEGASTGPGISPTFTSQTEFGWTAGGGIEYAFTDNLTAKVEYLYVDLGKSATCNAAASCGTYVPNGALATSNDIKFTENVVRLGINYKFGP